jgi:tryptophan synthase beta subunit
MESIQPAYAAWRAGATTLFLGSQPPQIVQKFQLSARIQRPSFGPENAHFMKMGPKRSVLLNSKPCPKMSFTAII